MMRVYLTSIFIVLAASVELQQFQTWMHNHHKSYNTESEFQHRFQIWLTNLQNHKSLNKFSDLSSEEFNALYSSGHIRSQRNSVKYELLNVEPVAHIDWRKRGVVSEVKDQGACGSCWAFATVGTIEATKALQTNTVTSLSSQQLVDCCRIQNYGCNGGDPEPALKCTLRDGIMSDTDYPYTGFNKLCNLNPDKVRHKFNDYILVIPQDPLQLKSALNIQPVSVCINADAEVFQHYSGGIIREDECRTTITHCVLAVGYGSDDGVDYWLLKNSWGVDWGEEGFFRLERNDNKYSLGTCGVLSEPMFSQ